MKNVLKAWIRKNLLTEDPSDYLASVVVNGSVTMQDIVRELVNEGMEVKSETAVDILTRFNRKTAELVTSGYNVNTGLVYMRPVIKGAFYGKTWDPNVHSVYVSINQGADLREAIAETSVEILGELSDPIEILSLTDTTTGKTDGSLTKGRNAELKGSFLKVTGDKPECGITFRNLTTQAITKLADGDIVLNEPSRLLIYVPAELAAGEYELAVTTQYSGGGKNLTTARSTSYATPIIIS
ncbi:MAG: DNA-binding domain-containing protein [Bacteroidota bacterium]|nr:DNA-binding domain-containing protein [Bacteroidota bacterium]